MSELHPRRAQNASELRFFFLSTLIFTLLLSIDVESREMTHRLGVGPRYNSSIQVMEVGTSYYPNENIGIVGGLGIDTQENNSKFSLNGTVRRLIFQESEKNMLVYFGGKLGMISYEDTQKYSGYELSAVFGGEFFIQGLDSLGFSFETGLGVVSGKSVRFRSIADLPLQAGVFFYF